MSLNVDFKEINVVRKNSIINDNLLKISINITTLQKLDKNKNVECVESVLQLGTFYWKRHFWGVLALQGSLPYDWIKLRARLPLSVTTHQLWQVRQNKRISSITISQLLLKQYQNQNIFSYLVYSMQEWVMIVLHGLQSLGLLGWERWRKTDKRCLNFVPTIVW